MKYLIQFDHYSGLFTTIDIRNERGFPLRVLTPQTVLSVACPKGPLACLSSQGSDADTVTVHGTA